MRRYVSRAAVIAAGTTTFVLALAGSALGATVSGFAPITGSVDDGGTVVTITGTGLLDATGVSFNGVPAAWFQVGSDSTLYARLPQGATTGPITVAAADGSVPSSLGLTLTGTNGGLFTIVAPQFVTQTEHNTATGAAAKASVASFSPASGRTGTKLTITGKNLANATGVKIGGAKATFTVVSATKLTAVVPKAAKSGKVSVTTPAGTATGAKSFTKL
jgi:IPT/TIG domain